MDGWRLRCGRAAGLVEGLLVLRRFADAAQLRPVGPPAGYDGRQVWRSSSTTPGRCPTPRPPARILAVTTGSSTVASSVPAPAVSPAITGTKEPAARRPASAAAARPPASPASAARRGCRPMRSHLHRLRLLHHPDHQPRHVPAVPAGHDAADPAELGWASRPAADGETP